jgi:hypothetical protein
VADAITRVLDYRGCRVTVRASYHTTEAGFLAWWQIEQGSKTDLGYIAESFPTAEGALAAAVAKARGRVDEAIMHGWLRDPS